MADITVLEGYPAVTAARMREIDRLATEKFSISADRLMENAGKAVANEILKLAPVPAADFCCVILCGRGNNGGDGLVIARYLYKAGAAPLVFLVPPQEGAEYGTLVLRNLKRAFFSHVSVRNAEKDIAPVRRALDCCHIVVDALLGTGSSGAPRGIFAELIQAANESGRTTVAVDLPSGMDADTGECAGDCIKADHTFMLGLPKIGLLSPKARRHTGALKVLDIGFPRELLA